MTISACQFHGRQLAPPTAATLAEGRSLDDAQPGHGILWPLPLMLSAHVSPVSVRALVSQDTTRLVGGAWTDTRSALLQDSGLLWPLLWILSAHVRTVSVGAMDFSQDARRLGVARGGRGGEGGG